MFVLGYSQSEKNDVTKNKKRRIGSKHYVFMSTSTTKQGWYRAQNDTSISADKIDADNRYR